MQRITLSMIVGVSALVVGVMLGANVFDEAALPGHANTPESLVVGILSEAPDLTPIINDLTARLEDSERQLQSHQQLLEQFNEELVSFKSSGWSGNKGAEVVAQSQAGQADELASQTIDAASFIGAGFSPDKAVQLEERYSDLELRRLYLRDQALREGWISEPRFGEERAKLNVEEEVIVDELGEGAYERYLYATGRLNRLSVLSVIRKSPAEASGIESGDVFYRYAGSRIYNSFDLRNASSDGEAGASVAVEVLRDGSIVQLYIPRGPLGVQLENGSVKP